MNPTDPGRCPGRATGPAASALRSPTCEGAGSHPNGWLYVAAALAVIASIALILAAYLT